MKHKIIFASSNSGKINELQTLLDEFNYEIIPQNNLGIHDAEETGLTFVENALLKARNACLQSGKPAIADDSGLVVAALDGAPGIYSARYAGKHSNAHANTEKLLKDLQDVPDENRHAHFHCTLVYLEHAEDPAPLICEGIWHGIILHSPAGTNGFGYDPVFYDADEKSSAAELSQTRKNQISHRGQALRSLIEKLKYARTYC
ncbi:MAG TPA: RdgB/HAM1 family non-canonical purine NTP pyrophosphatase [Gammaproteobacteria bacterium]|nr:RdgB/HAM1 family non-canonical purine NTP pyrophosphatase [Gammaproteobacteria bacterium]